MAKDRALAGLHPHRTGFCDGLFDRECKSPWTALGWRGMKQTSDYINGYSEGAEARRNGAGVHNTPNHTTNRKGY